MADGSDLASTGVAELAPRLASRNGSPVEVTAAVLARIERLEPQLNAFITLVAERARDAARAAEAAITAGDYRGPLHGIPVAIKDLFATRGIRTTFGSALFADWVPDFDAAATERLERAGAITLGKTNLHELAYGTTSVNAHYGPVRNPWRTHHHPGGSSGGSAAAVAAGMAHVALGSDTGASIRQPAACCGIVGIKPTFGRVSKYGALPLAWSMDQAGPLTRTVRDAAHAFDAVLDAGAKVRHRPVHRIRIARIGPGERLENLNASAICGSSVSSTAALRSARTPVAASAAPATSASQRSKKKARARPIRISRARLLLPGDRLRQRAAAAPGTSWRGPTKRSRASTPW